MVTRKQSGSTQEQHQSGKTRILLVDDHPIVRRGIAQLIEQESDLVVCGEAEDAPEALKAIATLKPNFVIVDITLKDSNGIDLIKSIKALYDNLPTLVVSMHDETLYADRAVRAGARGYVMKQEAAEKVLIAIREILKGGIYLSHREKTE